MNKSIITILSMCGALILSSCGNKEPEPEPIKPDILVGQDAIDWVNQHYTESEFKQTKTAFSTWNFNHTIGDTAIACVQSYIKTLLKMEYEEEPTLQCSYYEIEPFVKQPMRNTDFNKLIEELDKPVYYVKKDVLYVEGWVTGNIGIFSIEKYITKTFDIGGYPTYYQEIADAPVHLPGESIEGYIDISYTY